MADPLRFVSRASKIIKDLAAHIYDITRPAASTIWIGRGWDNDGSEHGTGRALDIIVARSVGSQPTPDELAAGWAVVDWLVANADALDIRHIIFRRKIYRHRYRAWGKLPNRSASASISDWHDDHIHVWLQSTNGFVPNKPLNGRVVVKAPLAPTNVSVDVNLSDRFRVAWVNNADDERPISRTEIWRTDRTQRSVCLASIKGQPIWYDDFDIVRDQAYTYTIVSFNDAGRAETRSNVVYTSPEPPASVALTRDGGNLVVDWSDASWTATGFEIEHAVNGEWQGTHNPTTSTTYSTQVSAEDAHRVRIRSLAPDGTPSAWTLSGTTRKEVN